MIITALGVSMHNNAPLTTKNTHFLLALVIFSMCIFFFLDWSVIKTLASPPLSFSSSPSSLLSLFGLEMNFDAKPLPCYGELNMPCPDLLSATTFIPLAGNIALKPSEKALISGRKKPHIIHISSLLGPVSWLFFCSILGQHC